MKGKPSKDMDKFFDRIDSTIVEMRLNGGAFIVLYSLIKEVDKNFAMSKELKKTLQKFLKDWEPTFNDLVPNRELKEAVKINSYKPHERN